ncbi:MAG TPA: hypothetical protein VM942_00360, partial [Acidimicrobiales bacterium]|nr:hypothetical protein [Acidimicrobiales bacterium]
QTSKPEEMQALSDEWRAKRAAEGGGPAQVFAGKDRDRENVYLTIVRFPSYEAAMENSQREDTNELSAKMGALCDGPPTFRNIDVLMQFPD